jgi:hypothetical protein
MVSPNYLLAAIKQEMCIQLKKLITFSDEDLNTDLGERIISRD